MSKLIIVGLAFAVSFVGTTAKAREVCKEETVAVKNCDTKTGKCTISYTTAQRCKQVPDTATGTQKAGAVQTTSGGTNPKANRNNETKRK
jgi:hypothetical protein